MDLWTSLKRICGFQTTAQDQPAISIDQRSELKSIVDRWHAGEDTWPWVWCQHNPVGPLYVFVLTDEASVQSSVPPYSDLLCRVQAIGAANRRNNILLVGSPDAVQQHGGEQKFFDRQCGIIHEKVAKLDPVNKIMMLGDERIVCFDECVFQ